jgi:hypothetical protein
MTARIGIRVLAPVLLVLLILPVFVPASAQDAGTPHTNDACLLCHDDESAARADGTSVFVDVTRLEASIHGQLQMQCVDCHADAATVEFPHPDRLARVDCSTCHDSAAEQFRKSVHARAYEAGTWPRGACVSCHGAHDILPAADPDSRSNPFNQPATCGGCHGDERFIASAHLEGGNVVQHFVDSIHGRALLRGGLVVAPTCTSCHEAHATLASDDPASRVFRFNQVEMCGTCHKGIQHQFDKGRHGELVAAVDARAPVCADCHSAHRIQRAETPTWRVEVINECGTCHVDMLRTYRDTFHGQVTNLGFARIATCADCHGAHQVLPQSDPASPTAAGNIVATCQKCHPGANENFARYDPHADKHNRDRNPVLFYTARFMELLLLGVFGFFGIHTTLWFTRSWRELRDRRARVAGGPETGTTPTPGGEARKQPPAPGAEGRPGSGGEPS